MALEFTFVAGRELDFLHAFAQRFDLVVQQQTALIPPAIGSGYIRQVELNNGVTLCLHHYQLRQTLVLRRLTSSPHELLIFKFNEYPNPTPCGEPSGDRPYPPGSQAVQVASSSLFTEEVYPAATVVKYLVLTVSQQHLAELLALDGASRTQWALLTGRKAFVLYERLTPEMSNIITFLEQLDTEAPLALLVCKTKAQELLYLLFIKLLARTAVPASALTQAEAEKITALEAVLLADLCSPPHLPTLALRSGLSATKMKQLFRQVFGTSVYDYYQVARMNEAARLLPSLSVAETGYALGFSNLSHFARLFEKHHGLKPKKYQAALQALPTSRK